MKRSTVLALVATGVTLAGSAVLMVPALASTTPSGLQAFYTQPAQWGRCPGADTASASPSPRPTGRPVPNGPNKWNNVQCATIHVPLDYHRPDGPQESVGLSRRLASDQGDRLGALIPVPGGPGGSGLDSAIDDQYDELATRYDIIGLDPRGVGADLPLSCHGPEEEVGWTRPTEAQMQLVVDSARARELACVRAAGDRLPYFTTANNARDLDIVRAALGEDKLNLMGQSYGTYVTAVYGTLFPRHLNRDVLDSAINPQWIWWEAWKHQAIEQNKVVADWMSWVAKRDDTYGLGTTADAVHASVEALHARLTANPIDMDGLTYDGEALDEGFVVVTEPGAWPVLAQSVDQLRDDAGDSVALTSLRTMMARRTGGPGGADAGDTATADGVWDAVNCEVSWPHDLGVYYDAMRTFGERYPYAWGAKAANPEGCAFRSDKPAEPLVAVHRAGYPVGVVVQGEFDPSTPYAGGQVMARLLSDRLVTGVREGRHVEYGQNDCATTTVNAYFLDGTLPAVGARCAGGDPNP